MRNLVEALSKQYDYVIVDLSPLAPIIDVRSTGHFISSYVLVVEWGKTNIEVLERALAGARSLQENLLGVVLNKADMEAMRNYSRSAGESYKNSYYERYGFED